MQIGTALESITQYNMFITYCGFADLQVGDVVLFTI